MLLRLVEIAATGVDEAQVLESTGLAQPVAELRVDGEGLFEVLLGPVGITAQPVKVP